MVKPKQVNYELVPEVQVEPYKLLEQVRRKWHAELVDARIALAWRVRLKADKDGQLVLGRCVKVSDLHREVAEYDFIVVLNREVWDAPEFGKDKEMARLDHELCHAGVVLDKNGEKKQDERGRGVYRMRKHDIEEFCAVVERHGCYKRDLEAFAKALLRKAEAPLLAGIEETGSKETGAVPN